MNADLYCAGLNHKTAPLEVREHCALSPDAMTVVMPRLRRMVEHGVLLATCGRVELYLTAFDRRHGPERVFAEVLGVSLSRVESHLQILRDHAVVRHLLRVAAGLESQIIGEDHIQAQVRKAFAAAQEAGLCGPVLAALGRAAVRAGKRVRHETTINRIPLSFARLALQDLLGTSDPNELGCILILGSGVMARDVAREVRNRYPDIRLGIAGRDPGRALLLADETGAQGYDLADVPPLLKNIDVVFACTSSRRFLISSELVASRERPLYVYDLGVPRNIDPAVGSVAGVSLRHLDDLKPVGADNSGVLEQAGMIVEEEAARFARWHQARQRVSRSRRDSHVDGEPRRCGVAGPALGTRRATALTGGGAGR